MIKEKLIPELRFPEFKNEGEWEEKTLGSVAEIVTGNTPSTAERINYNGTKLFVSPGDINDNRYVTQTKTTLSEIGFLKTRKINANSVLFVCIGSTIGKVAQNKFECATNQQLNSLIPFEENSSDFLYSILDFNSAKIALIAGNHAVPIINKTSFSAIKLNFPSKPQEQQRIASCLSSLDEVIAAHSQKLDVLKEHKKGLMQNLFPQEGETVPKYRFKEFEKVWKKVKLKDVSSYFNGGSYENDVKEKGKYELITLKSINTSGKLVNSKRYIDIEAPTLTKGTLIMILSEQAPGLLGMTAIIPTENKYVLNQRVAEIRPNQKVESYFLSMSINRNQIYFSKQGAGTKVQNISKPNVENYNFLLPEIQEQQKIASCLFSLDAHITAQAEKIEQMKLHKKALMQGLFPKIND